MMNAAEWLMSLPVYTNRPTGERYCTVPEERRDEIAGDIWSALAMVSVANGCRDEAQAAARALLPHVLAVDDDAKCYSVPQALFDKLIEAVGLGREQADQP